MTSSFVDVYDFLLVAEGVAKGVVFGLQDLLMLCLCLVA